MTVLYGLYTQNITGLSINNNQSIMTNDTSFILQRNFKTQNTGNKEIKTILAVELWI